MSEWKAPRPRDLLIALALVVVGVVSFSSAQAFASGNLVLSDSTDLVQAQVIQVAGSGLTPGTYGYILECNDTPGEPTVSVGAPFDQQIPIGCSAPSLKHIVMVSSSGTLKTDYEVHLSRKNGPPCSYYSVFGPCARHDSAGMRARADAQNFPCPPSPAQQAAGVGCSLVFYDAAHDVVSTPISFLGGAGPPPKGGAGGGSGGTLPTTPTTSAGTSPTSPTTSPAGVSSGGGGAGGGSGGGGASTGSRPSGSVTAPSSSLAFTGLGTGGKVLAVAGALLVLGGLVLLFVNLRRLALWFLGY